MKLLKEEISNYLWNLFHKIILNLKKLPFHLKIILRNVFIMVWYYKY